MSYSHYWRFLKTPSHEEWSQLILDSEKLFESELPILPEPWQINPPRICGADGKGPPRVTTAVIAFNGDAKAEASCEPFELKRLEPPSINYFRCSTRRKPYDLVVCGVLICAYNRFSSNTIEVNSDGDYSDWKPAIDWVRATFPGEKFVHPFLDDPKGIPAIEPVAFDLRAVLDGIEAPDLFFA